MQYQKSKEQLIYVNFWISFQFFQNHLSSNFIFSWEIYSTGLEIVFLKKKQQQQQKLGMRKICLVFNPWLHQVFMLEGVSGTLKTQIRISSGLEECLISHESLKMCLVNIQKYLELTFLKILIEGL